MRSGRIILEDDGPGLLPFQLAAFTLEAGQISLTQSGVGWSIVRPVSPLEPGRLIPLADVADTLRIELTQRERKRMMDEWSKESEAKLAALTSYRAGWDPSGLRREALFPVPAQPQRRWAQYGLPEGEYTYEQLVELGCAGDFPIPGVDGPPCPEPRRSLHRRLRRGRARERLCRLPDRRRELLRRRPARADARLRPSTGEAGPVRSLTGRLTGNRRRRVGARAQHGRNLAVAAGVVRA